MPVLCRNDQKGSNYLPFLRPGFAGYVFLSIIAPAEAKHLHTESEYRDVWCQGKTEVRLPNGTRVDCLTEQYATEVEFAHKWHEAIGQALDYADQTGKQPGILLIIEREKDWRYYNKLKPVAEKHRIMLWHITPQQIP